LRDRRTLALEEAPGTTLEDVFRQDVDPAPAARAVARAVARFNVSDVEVTRHHSLADQLADVNRASTLVQWACPEKSEDVKTVVAAVRAGLEEVTPAPIHRDLKLDHIFVEGERVLFIDLDSVALGDPVRDPAHLCAHIVGRVGTDPMPAERAREAASAFVEEYFAHVSPSWRERFALHSAGALIEVAGGVFKRQEPQWRQKVAAAVEEAQYALSWAGGAPMHRRLLSSRTEAQGAIYRDGK
jgi:hypothetical protein